MQDPLEFLNTILPPLNENEWYIYYSKGQDGVKQSTACATVEAILAKGQQATEDGLGSHFVLGSTTQPALLDTEADSVTANASIISRKGFAMRAYKCAWVDLDCGEGKPYRDEAEAEYALVQFAKAVQLPPSYVIKSGHGLHVYWAFNMPYFASDDVACSVLHIELPAWEQAKAKYGLLCMPDLMGRFYAVCRHFGLYTDAAVKSLNHSLRLPGTMNFKDPNNPVPCVVHRATNFVWTQPKFNSIITSLINNNNIVVQSKPNRRYEAASVPMRGIETIVQECEQLREMGTGCEPEWRAGICVCLCCEDGESWIHKLSAKDSRYTVEKTDEYINKCNPAAVHCATFDGYRKGLCNNCPHYKKITSPVQLARYMKRAAVPAQDPIRDHIVFPPRDFPCVPYQSFGDTDFFCNDYGIWKKQVDDSGTPTKPVHVANVFIEYLYSITTPSEDMDRDAYDVFRTFIVGSKEEYIRYFPTKILGDPKKIIEWCSQYRLIALAAPKLLAAFMNAYVTQQSNKGTAHVLEQYDSYGWHENSAHELKFILDEYAISTAVEPIVPVQPEQSVYNMRFTHAGTLEEWKKIPQLYRELNQPLGQLAICMAFAAPFLHYGVGEAKNCIMNIYSYDGGRGKSHLLKACASVYGNPATAFIQNSASATAVQKLLALHRHLPVFMDEIGNRDNETIANLVFTMINGVEKQKLTKNSTLKKTGWWNTAVFTSANRPLKDVMATIYADTNAGVLRVMDCKCNFARPDPGSEMAKRIGDSFITLEHNYGIAGPEFIYQILKDPARLATIASRANAFVVRYGFKSEERFYSYPLAIALLIGRWAVEFGILDYDMDELEKWVTIELLGDLRVDDTFYNDDPESFINEFLNENLKKNCLIVAAAERTAADKTVVTANGLLDPYVVQYPTNNIYMRYEVDTYTLSFSSKAFKDWCQRQNKSFKKYIDYAMMHHIILPKKSKVCLGKHVPRFAASSIHCYTLDKGYVFKNIRVEKGPTPMVPFDKLQDHERAALRGLQQQIGASL